MRGAAHSTRSENGRAVSRTVSRTADLLTLAAILLLVLAAGIAAADEGLPMRFDRLWLDEGLSQSNVLAVHQDREGLLWIGTENGLNRFDGYEFRHYRRERGNPRALGSDFIFDIAEDADGNLWLATNGAGIARMDRASGTFTTYRHDPERPSSIGSNIVRRVFVDSDGHVYAGTRGAGLSRLNPASGEFVPFTLPGAGEQGDNVFAIMRDAAGQMWIGGDFGLARLNTESGAAVLAGSFEHSVRAIFEDSDGSLWIGTYGGGLARFDRETGVAERFVHDPELASTISGDKVSSIFEDSAGRLWVGTTSGLNLLDRTRGGFTRYANVATDATSLAGNDVTAIYEDRGGMLWVGTKMHGLNKWNSRSWAYGLERTEKLSVSGERAPSVMAFTEGVDGTLYVGTFGEGLNAVNRTTGEVVHYRHDRNDPGSIGDDRVMSLMHDAAGRIWVGTMTAGIDRLDPVENSIERFRHDADDPESLSANGVMTMYEDRDGQVWVGTFGGGISRFDPATGRFTRFTNDPSDPHSLGGNRVTSFAQDGAGRMWVGTDGAGLNLYDPEARRFHRFRHDPDDPHALADDTVYSLAVDAAGRVWIGTRGGGLDRVVGDPANPATIRFENRSQADGLPNDVVYGIRVAATGELWLSTNYGLSRYNPDNDSFRNLHRRDGLQSDEFNFGAHFRNDSGELFFGGTHGYNAFDPAAIAINATPPAIVMTDVDGGGDGAKYDIPLNEDGGIEMAYSQNTVSFEFAALDFASPEANRYMYKLEGFDKEWIDLGSRRRVTYTDLDDGNYLLRVRAANSDGVWNDAGIAVPVRVTPALWDTWWAYLGYLAMLVQLVALCWYAHKARIRREEEYSHRLEKAVAERTDKLRESNAQLTRLNKALQESSLSDPLTGLRNRRFVFEEISRDFDVIRRKNSDEQAGVDRAGLVDLVFMMIDLDNFKPINDTYGHAAGDQMLLEVRDVLLSTCRRSDYVVRWGGDEFVVIAKQTDPGECEALAERIRSRIAQHNFVLPEGQIVRTTCSIGFSAYPLFRASSDESSLDQIIGVADALMYEAKKQRNAWAGMFAANEASTSFAVAETSVDPTSVLFRARRAGMLSVHQPDEGESRFAKTEAG